MTMHTSELTTEQDKLSKLTIQVAAVVGVKDALEEDANPEAIVRNVFKVAKHIYHNLPEKTDKKILGAVMGLLEITQPMIYLGLSLKKATCSNLSRPLTTIKEGLTKPKMTDSSFS